MTRDRARQAHDLACQVIESCTDKEREQYGYGYTECATCGELNVPIIEWFAPERCWQCEPLDD